MRRRQPNAIIILALGIVLSAMAVVIPMAARPRAVLVGVGLAVVVFALLRLFQQR